jgi:hypothetical protein
MTAEDTAPLTAFGAPLASPDAGGLSSADAQARLAANGPNTLPVPPAEPAWRQLLG